MSANSTAPLLVNSLVFFDLETTGLLNDPPTKITEIFLFSIQRDHFVDCSKSKKLRPRISNRLNLCINPSRKIATVFCSSVEVTRGGIGCGNLRSQRRHFERKMVFYVQRWHLAQ